LTAKIPEFQGLLGGASAPTISAMTNINTITPILQPRDEAESHEVLGGSITIRLRSEDTDGRLALIEQVVPAGFPGPALHLHPEFDETFYVLEGTVAFRVGEEAYDAVAGTTAFIPRGVPHTFANPNGQPARTLVLLAPGGFERYFEALIAAIAEAGGFPPADEVVALGIAHGSVPA
jgi:quercetin dioxygenase-like cupin family protein